MRGFAEPSSRASFFEDPLFNAPDAEEELLEVPSEEDAKSDVEASKGYKPGTFTKLLECIDYGPAWYIYAVNDGYDNAIRIEYFIDKYGFTDCRAYYVDFDTEAGDWFTL